MKKINKAQKAFFIELGTRLANAADDKVFASVELAKGVADKRKIRFLLFDMAVDLGITDLGKNTAEVSALLDDLVSMERG